MDKKETKLVLSLPCNPGDTVYTPCAWGIEEGKAMIFEYFGGLTYDPSKLNIKTEYNQRIGTADNVFVNREDAVKRGIELGYSGEDYEEEAEIER